MAAVSFGQVFDASMGEIFNLLSGMQEELIKLRQDVIVLGRNKGDESAVGDNPSENNPSFDHPNADPDDLYFGYWFRNDLIRMNDPRLWEGDHAPFTSYNTAIKAKAHGCPFFSPGSMRFYSIKAGDLFDWLQNMELQKQIRKRKGAA